MQTKKYLVTNNSEGSICVTGRTRIDIPGMCRDLPLTLPENTARQTISRLKQRYPLLKISEAQETGNESNANSSLSGKASVSKGNGGKTQKPANAESPQDENLIDSSKEPVTG